MLGSMVRALIVLALLLASCAQEAAAPPSSESPTPEESATPTEEPPSPPPEEVECVDATASGKAEVTVRMVDDEFAPACLTVLGGQGLKLTNRGANLHNFSVEGSDVDIDIPPGETVRTQAIGGAVSSGTHVFFCEYHRSGGMEGEITVSEAG